MPFEQITTIRHSGAATREEKFLIHTTAGDYIGAAEYTEYPMASLCLHPDHWPPVIAEAAEAICIELRRRGVDADPSKVTAWIKYVSRLVESADGLTIELQWGVSLNSRRTIRLEGTIISLTPM